MAVSQNGWPVSPPRSSRTIPGTEVRVTVADGPAGDVLMYVLAQVDRRVEDIDLKSTRGEFDDWGFADRTVRGSTDTSNHASATAVDVNATRHPLGSVGTFTAAQAGEIHRILGEVDHVVRWGGDYSGRKDEMHFEINAGYAAVAAVAAVAGRLNSTEDDMPLTSADTNKVWMQPCTGTGPDGKTQTWPAAVWVTVMAFRIAQMHAWVAELVDREPNDVDEAAVAANLAPMLVDALADQLSELDENDYARIATAVADENARRQAA